MKCVLCKSRSTTIIDTLDKNKVQEIWQQEYGIDVSAQITEDINLFECSDCRIKFWDPAPEGSADFYKALAMNPWYYPESKWEYDISSSWVSARDEVLEVGCGLAHFSRRIPATYRGLELNPDVADGITILNQTIQLHSKEFSGCYDWVFAFQMLEHTKDPAVIIDSMLDCLKPNGRLVLGLPNDTSWLGQARMFALNTPPHHLTRWSVGTLENLSSLKNIHLERVDFMPFKEDYALKFITNPNKNTGDILLATFRRASCECM
jgi:SAM-dependent methyltransferase